MPTTTHKFDNLVLGLILGLLCPFLGLLGFYLWKFAHHESLQLFLVRILSYRSLLSSVISFSLIANALVFTIFINQRKDKTAKGIFVFTLVYVIIALIIKYFL
ncbi:MAG TPA: hypothetical protein DCL43_04700 [Chitinophagaceae bacterium]|nr:hypothetical protein [Chitinophagaceae bacterium]HAN38849.1 hypothetical protein [Chitinophagaceae bacterium]